MTRLTDDALAKLLALCEADEKGPPPSPEVVAALVREVVALRERCDALAALLGCYRLGKRPPESLHKRLERSKDALDALDEGEGKPWLCEHANENPNVCPCQPGCYCKTRTCRGKP